MVMVPAETIEMQAAEARDRIADKNAEIARLREGLRRIKELDYDAGYSADEYADAVLNGHEPQAE